MRISSKNVMLLFFLVHITLLIIKNHKKIRDFNSEMRNFVFYAYVAFIISITLFPIEIPPEKFDFFSYGYINLNIFDFLHKPIHKINMANIAGNLCMFVPLATLIGFKFGKLITSYKFILVLISTSLSIEFLQLLENITYISGLRLRIVDVNDVLYNVAGGILGYIIYKAYLRIAGKRVNTP